MPNELVPRLGTAEGPGAVPGMRVSAIVASPLQMEMVAAAPTSASACDDCVASAPASDPDRV